MTSKKSNLQELKRLLKQESLFHMSYKDGKPVKEKEPTDLELLQKELTPDDDKNPADMVKSALYADTPKAKQKYDKSINARTLNQAIESYNAKRAQTLQRQVEAQRQIDRSKFELARLKMLNAPHCMIYYGRHSDGRPIWAFQWTFKTGSITTLAKPDDGYNIEYKNSSLTQLTDKNIEKVYDILEKSMKLMKN